MTQSKKKLQLSRFLSYFFNFNLVIIIFTGSLNLFYKFNHQQAFVQGWLVDYLLPKLYLSDIFIWLFILVSLIYLLKSKGIDLRKRRVEQDCFFDSWQISLTGTCLVLLLGFILRQFFTLVPVIAFYQLFKYFQIIVFGFCLYKQRHFFKPHVIFWSLILLIFFQTGLGIYQFLAQQSLLPYSFLGETNISQPLGLPRFNFPLLGERVLPYGTFPHPNILAGVLTLVLLTIMQFNLQKPVIRHQKKLVIASVCLIILLTQSATAGATLILGLGFLFLTKKKMVLPIKALRLIPLFLIPLCSVFIFFGTKILPHNLSFTRRHDLEIASFNLLQKFPLTGAGLSQFTPHLPQIHPSPAPLNFHQPVHNIVYLFVSETGLLGLSLLACVIVFFYRIWQNLTFKSLIKQPLPKPPLFVSSSLISLFTILSPLMLFDHYLLTTQSGLLAFMLFIILNLGQKSASAK